MAEDNKAEDKIPRCPYCGTILEYHAYKENWWYVCPKEGRYFTTKQSEELSKYYIEEGG